MTLCNDRQRKCPYIYVERPNMQLLVITYLSFYADHVSRRGPLKRKSASNSFDLYSNRQVLNRAICKQCYSCRNNLVLRCKCKQCSYISYGKEKVTNLILKAFPRSREHSNERPRHWNAEGNCTGWVNQYRWLLSTNLTLSSAP